MPLLCNGILCRKYTHKNPFKSLLYSNLWKQWMLMQSTLWWNSAHWNENIVTSPTPLLTEALTVIKSTVFHISRRDTIIGVAPFPIQCGLYPICMTFNFYEILNKDHNLWTIISQNVTSFDWSTSYDTGPGWGSLGHFSQSMSTVSKINAPLCVDCFTLLLARHLADVCAT